MYWFKCCGCTVSSIFSAWSNKAQRYIIADLIDFSEFSPNPSAVTSVIVSLLHLLTTPTPLLLVTHPSPTLPLAPPLSHWRVLVLSIKRDSIKQFPMKYPLEKIKLFNAK